MKLKKLLLVGLALLSSITITQAAQSFSAGVGSPGYYTFGGTNFVLIPDTGTYPIPGLAPGPTSIAQTPIVQYINAQSDKAGSVFTAWYAYTNSMQLVATNLGTTTNQLSGTNGITAGLPVVITHTAAGSPPEVRIVSSVTSSNAIVTTNTSYPYALATNYTWAVILNAAPTYNCSIGDTIQGYVVQGTIAWGAATNSLSASGAPVIAGQYQTPFLGSLNFTSAGSINLLSGTFQ